MSTQAAHRKPGGSRLFWSDLHLGHALVSDLRGFDTTQDHDDAICAAWTQQVCPRDEVFVLGDIVGRTDQTEHALGLLADLPGTKHLIAGNHDSVSSIHRNGWKHQREFLEVFASVRDFARIRVHRNQVLLSHYPYIGEGDDHSHEARYEQFRLPDLGEFLLHGHTHNAEQRVHGRQLHVGVDAWPDGPVSDAVVAQELGM